MKLEKERNLIIISAIVAIALAIGLPFLTKPNADLLPKFALSQLTFSAVAFFIVFLTLYFTIVQLRRAMAKPKLEAIFTKTNNSECSVAIHPRNEENHYLRLSVINKGNAITDLFQIDFNIPKIFNPIINSNTFNSVHHHDIGNNRVLSFLNKHEYVCFVNISTSIPSLVLETNEKDYDKYSNHLIIPYKIFGDWAETQEGTLKVKINKQ